MRTIFRLVEAAFITLSISIIASCSTVGVLPVAPDASNVETDSETLLWDVGVRLRKVLNVLGEPFDAETITSSPHAKWLISAIPEGLMCEQATKDGTGIAATIILYDGSESERNPLGLQHSETGVRIKILGSNFTATQRNTPLDKKNPEHRQLVNSLIVAAHDCVTPLEQAAVKRIRTRANSLP